MDAVDICEELDIRATLHQSPERHSRNQPHSMIKLQVANWDLFDQVVGAVKCHF
jgi:hypothetical protein